MPWDFFPEGVALATIDIMRPGNSAATAPERSLNRLLVCDFSAGKTQGKNNWCPPSAVVFCFFVVRLLLL